MACSTWPITFTGPVFTLATAGFPLAVAQLVSESSSLGRWNDARQVKQVAMPLFFGSGRLGLGAMACLAPLYCRWVTGAAYALAPMIALAPAVLLACAASVYRGYYEGLGNMVPTAFSQVLEAAVKLALGLAAAWWAVSFFQGEYAAWGTVLGLVPDSQEQALFFTLSLGAAAALLGVTAGSLVSLLYLALRFRLHGDGTVPRLYRQSPPARGKGGDPPQAVGHHRAHCLGLPHHQLAGLIDATFLQSRVGATLQNRAPAAAGGVPGANPGGPTSGISRPSPPTCTAATPWP